MTDMSILPKIDGDEVRACKPAKDVRMRRSRLRHCAIAICMLAASIVLARAASPDADAVMAADRAFYEALSGRNLATMKAVWLQAPYVINIGPRSKAMNVGYEATVKYWEGAFDFFSHLDVSKTESHVQTDGATAWVVGIENAVLQPKSGGEALRFDTFVTHIYEKHDGRWLLVLHHAQMIPK